MSSAIILILLGSGIYLTIGTKFFSLTKLNYIVKHTFNNMFSKKTSGVGDVTPFQAVSTALAATVGTGNISGVATAITIGGPGAIFWMWIAAVFGMTTKYSEVLLAIYYRKRTKDGRYVGGPMYYIENGLKMKWLACIFALCASIASFGIGNMVQSNSVADSLNATFNINPITTGIILSLATTLVIIGGIKRIGSFAEIFVPFMAALYIIGGLVILSINVNMIPKIITLIFDHALSGHAAVGGFTGATVMHSIKIGVARGVFTNEAGLGSAPIAHAAAITDNPVQQGLWGIFEVLVDTIIICSITAFVILVSGLWNSGLTGAGLTTAAFETLLPNSGFIVSIGSLFFAFASIIGWEYYGERCIEYLFGHKVILPYRILWSLMLIVGAISDLTEIWLLSDVLNGLMAIPNLIGVIFLSPIVFKLTNDHFKINKANHIK
ncbi:sodium:alanine symporter family protein [Tissierella sp. Yu-01]|uniref:alanine/glycine:cation symporter family protein n=1 Tax=Tissierella sp. Yu-01 TaxID=3035694 RepID=UPI00240CF581|nr:sodium:alanine symporter family protein [Tissierella sp. Yu-01]WFA07861.1 sodium:alanine symporter family protein [Tissierella sp. Yu-01]